MFGSTIICSRSSSLRFIGLVLFFVLFLSLSQFAQASVESAGLTASPDDIISKDVGGLSCIKRDNKDGFVLGKRVKSNDSKFKKIPWRSAISMRKKRIVNLERYLSSKSGKLSAKLFPRMNRSDRAKKKYLRKRLKRVRKNYQFLLQFIDDCIEATQKSPNEPEDPGQPKNPDNKKPKLPDTPLTPDVPDKPETPGPKLSIGEISHSRLDGNQIELNFRTSFGATSTLSYGIVGVSNQNSAVISSEDRTSHSIILTLNETGSYLATISAQGSEGAQIFQEYRFEFELEEEEPVLSISNIRISQTSATKVRVRYSTNIPADSSLRFALQGSSSFTNVFGSEGVTSHSIEISPSEEGRFFVEVRARSESGQSVTADSSFNFERPTPSPDPIPVITISDIAHSKTGDNSVRLSFVTNLEASADLEYSISGSTRFVRVSVNSSGRNHFANLTLSESGSYEVRITAEADGANSGNGTYSFEFSLPEEDPTPPPPSPDPVSCTNLPKPSTSQLSTRVGALQHYAQTGKYNSESIYYVASNGQTFGSLAVSPVNNRRIHRVMIRVLDPEENVVFWKYIDHENPEQASNRFEAELSQASKLPDVFCLPERGVYQIQVFSSQNTWIDLNLSEGTEYGVSYLKGKFHKWDTMPDTMWAWAPVHRELPLQLKISYDTPGVSIYDETTGSDLSSTNPVVASHASREGHIWRFSFTNPDFQFRSLGFPLILTSSREAAESIHASVERISNGPFRDRLVSHKFQVDFADLIPKLLQNSGNASELYNRSPANYPSTIDACSQPERDADVRPYTTLLGYHSGTFTGARWILGQDPETGVNVQNTSLESHWAGVLTSTKKGFQECETTVDCANGSSCNSGQCSREFSFTTDYWDTFQKTTYSMSERNGYGGLSPRHWGSSVIGAAYSALNYHPCNFYGPDTPAGAVKYPEILSRAVAGNLSDHLSIQENGSWLNPGYDQSFYGSPMTFPMFQKSFPPFAVVVPNLNRAYGSDSNIDLTKLKNSWIAAMRLQFDRSFVDRMISARNQSAHNLVSYQSFYEGLKGTELEELYGNMTRLWSNRFIRSQSTAGYLEEARGPDASYIGMTHWFMSTYLGMTRDDALGEDLEMKDAIVRSYDFFNHTVFPEPSSDSTIAGFNFNHRIGFGIESEQWSGAKYNAHNIPSVAVWNRNWRTGVEKDRRRLLSASRSFDQNAAQLHTISPGTLSSSAQFGDLNQVSASLKFPAESSQSFTKNFGNELIAVNRPGYFASIYVGKPAEPFYIRKRENFREPSDNEGESPESENSVDIYKTTPFTGGGLSVLGFRDFGTAVVGATWSALTRNGLLAVTNGKRYWEKYHSVEFVLDANNDSLIVSGEIESVPIDYFREYQFLDDELVIRIVLTARADIDLDSLSEVIPVPTCTRSNCKDSSINNRKREGSRVEAYESSSEGSRVASFFNLTDSLGQKVKFDFGQSQNLTIEQDGLRRTYYNDELQIGWVKVELPNRMAAGETHILSYTISEQ